MPIRVSNGRFNIRTRMQVSNGVAPPPPTPEYWWRADSGLSISAWTAYAGGVNLTLNSMTAYDSTNGAQFNGTTSYGQSTSVLGADIIAKHVLIRYDSLGLSGTVLSSTEYNISEIMFGNGSDAGYYVVESNAGGSSYSYASQAGVAGTKLQWVDFANNASGPDFYKNTSTVKDGTYSVYAGVYTQQWAWRNGYSIVVGKRGVGDFLSGYIKEIAIFTTAHAATSVAAFRDTMNSRWP